MLTFFSDNFWKCEITRYYMNLPCFMLIIKLIKHEQKNVSNLTE